MRLLRFWFLSSVLKNSKDGDYTISLGNLLHHLTVLTVRIFFHYIQLEPLISVYVHCFSPFPGMERTDGTLMKSEEITVYRTLLSRENAKQFHF